MLLIATSMAFHLSFAIHCCSGHVASVSLFGHPTGTCCCGDDCDDDATRPRPTATFPNAANLLTGLDTPCCSDKIITLETDEYQTPSAATLHAPALQVTPILFLPAQPLQLKAAPASRITYPPGGLPRYGINLLTQICILRI